MPASLPVGAVLLLDVEAVRARPSAGTCAAASRPSPGSRRRLRPAWIEHERVALVVLAGEEAAQLELGEAAVDSAAIASAISGSWRLVLQLAGELGERLGVLELLGRARRSRSRSAVTADSSPVTLRARSASSHRSGRRRLGLELRPPGRELVDAQVLAGLVEARPAGAFSSSEKSRMRAAVAELELLAAAARAGRVARRLVPLALHHRHVRRRRLRPAARRAIAVGAGPAAAAAASPPPAAPRRAPSTTGPSPAARGRRRARRRSGARHRVASAAVVVDRGRRRVDRRLPSGAHDVDLHLHGVADEVVWRRPPSSASNMSKPSRCHSVSGSFWPMARRLMPSRR